MLACKNKTAKNLKLIIKIIINPRPNIEKKSSKVSDQEIDKGKNWAKNPTKKSFRDFNPKNKDYV